MPLNTDISFIVGKGIVLKNDDVTLTSGYECLVQEIKIESITAQGDLWYDQDYGWSLQDFIHRNVDDMLKLEIFQRIKTKMSRRPEVDKASIKISVIEKPDDIVCTHLSFTINGNEYELDIGIDRVKNEVKILG